MTQTRLKAKIDEGIRLQRAGRLQDAAKTYRKILADEPRQPDALHLMGVIAQNLGNLSDAVELIAESLRIQPDNVAAMGNLANVLQAQRRLPEALEFFDAAIEASPEESYLHCNRGTVLKDLGFYSEAIAAYQKALEIDPGSHAAYSNLGIVYKDCGEAEAATICYQRAIKLNPKSYEAHSNLGVLLRDQGKFEESVNHLQMAVTLNPKSDAAFCNLGASFKDLGKKTEAVGCYCKALELNPESHYALNNLGSLLKEGGRHAEARGCFEKAIAFKPDFHLAHNNLGSALCELGRTREALECFRRASELSPNYYHAFSNLLFALNYVGDTDRAFLFSEHCRFDECFGSALRRHIQPHDNRREPERALRVGFVSGDFREHPVSGFIEPVFAHHDKAQFEFFCYSTHATEDAMSERLRGQVEHWRRVIGWSDDELAAAIRRDEIDILVDLSGHTQGNRLLVFARKPAPVQVTMIGYMQTSGLSTMDYRITDERLDPTGESEAFNTEQLVRIEVGAATFAPPADSPAPNELPALTNGHVTFGSFNNLAKVTPEVISAWAEILHAVPGSRLLVVGRSGGPVIGSLIEQGIDATRIEFIERLPLNDFLALHHRVDVLLDTFPYNGGTTNLLALWMGVAFVSAKCGTGTGRTGASLLESFGLADFLGNSAAEYVQCAISAAGNLERLSALRHQLRPLLAPCLDGAIYTRQLEAAFREMWRRWCAND